MQANTITFSASEFVAVFNQTIEYAYPTVTITGELANLRISKNRWVYFDLKDDEASVKFFGTIYQLPGPLEDGMMMAVQGMPRLHPQYGFSVTVQSMRLTGEGSIKKAAKLLEAKLAAEGLFAAERKRPIPYPPHRIGLITSAESAAYKDFLKVIGARWGGLHIALIDVQVQGDAAVSQIVAAVEQFNQLTSSPDVLVVTRGGGSPDDLQAFNTEQVTRAIATSRIPTVVAIGHEVDISLAELAADQRASTPSNAAELLVPDKKALLTTLQLQKNRLTTAVNLAIETARRNLKSAVSTIRDDTERVVLRARQRFSLRRQVLEAFNPQAALNRGYALVRSGDKYIRSGSDVEEGDSLDVELVDAHLTSIVKRVRMI
jgi:exodeoxyribonuclease VII large subunit